MKPLRFTPEALDDVRKVYRRYETARLGLGARFVDRLGEAADVIQLNPEGPQEILPGLRHVRLKKFDAYALWYVTRDEILVIGCLHGRRNLPKVIRQRRNALKSETK